MRRRTSMNMLSYPWPESCNEVAQKKMSEFDDRPNAPIEIVSPTPGGLESPIT